MNPVVRESNCFVPGCINSSTSDSGKLFFPLPRETSARSNWCVTVGLPPSSTHSTSYCCEDHFNLEEDVENWEQYATWKHEELKTLCVRLKKDAIPHLNLQDSEPIKCKEYLRKTTEDRFSVIASDTKCEVKLLDALPEDSGTEFLKNEISAPGPSFGKDGSSPRVAALTKVVKDETTFAGGVDSSEEIQGIPSGSSFDLNVQIKTEAVTEDEDFVNALHTSIEIKDEDPLEWREYQNISETHDPRHTSNFCTRDTAFHDKINENNIGRIENDLRFNQLLSRIPKGNNICEYGGVTPAGEVKKTVPNAKIDKITHTPTGKNGKCYNHGDPEQAIHFQCDQEGATDGTGEQSNYNLCAASLSKEDNSQELINTHTGEQPFSCSHCSASFTTISQLTVHTRTYLTANMHIHTAEKPFICSHCSASFSEKFYLNKHIRIHTGEKPFSCSHCSSSFARKFNLKAHLRTHTGEKPFSCSHCSASFADKSNLKRHMRTHTGEEPFACRFCSASYSKKSHFWRHLRIHTCEKPFSCSHCSSAFTQKSSLKCHMRVHNGEKPFSCSYCSASFAAKSQLTCHIRTHTGEKPFSCSHCSSSFATKFNLKAHMRTHTGEKPFSCSHCLSSFAEKSKLKAHMRTHTGERPFKCNHCKLF